MQKLQTIDFDDSTGELNILYDAILTTSSREIVVVDEGGNLFLCDARSGKVVKTLKFPPSGNAFLRLSPNGNFILVGSPQKNEMTLINARTFEWVYTQLSSEAYITGAEFSPDGKWFLCAARDQRVRVFEVETGKERYALGGHAAFVNSAQFSGDGQWIITSTGMGDLKVWDAGTGGLLYTYILLPNDNYLVFDKDRRFDGTEAARKMLYYVCGDEIIDLDQIKDLCWEPGLVEKIMQQNEEPIKAKRMDEIPICNVSPLIETMEGDKDQKKFRIKSRGGGVGEVTVYINQKEVDRIPVNSLDFKNGEAIVTVDLTAYESHLEAGKENSVQLRARTSDLSISSKGAALPVKVKPRVLSAPDLYALVVGVSDYKGNELDLKYAAKDAEDFGKALRQSAAKLLNVDGREHVFVTTLVSNTGTTPSKVNINRAFEEIRARIKANDILVIYLSGHGENYGTETTNFYYLTEEASSFNLAGIEKEVAISTNEFADWLRSVPAGKRVMVLDACASGKLARDIVFAMKAGIPSDQIRSLDRLNSRTGTFILSGAAANQSAYETSIYGQGLLTYSLLYGMKTGTALRDQEFLDVDKLFQFSADKVKDLASEIGGIQEPVISKPDGGASFDIGKVDTEVAANIVLALPKPIFTNSKFYNRETDDDNLGLEKAVDDLLNNLGSRGKESPLLFTERSQLRESYKLVGSYQLNGDQLLLTVRIKKGQTELKKFELSGKADSLPKLTAEIIEQVKTLLGP